jgi:hypothetical protein
MGQQKIPAKKKVGVTSTGMASKQKVTSPNRQLTQNVQMVTQQQTLSST